MFLVKKFFTQSLHLTYYNYFRYKDGERDLYDLHFEGVLMARSQLRTTAGVLVAAVFIGCSFDLIASAASADDSAKFESPDGQKILNSDLLGAPNRFAAPSGCVKSDVKSIERGRLFFNELNNDSNVSSKYAQEYPKSKQFGNCVACHQIEKSNGHGNIGPDLSKYNENYVKSGARTHAWMFQKIADPRIDNPHTSMTVNLATKLMNESEVCDIVSYIVSEKK
jgi:L-cysteine S-thiosulfotransferase